MKIFVASAWINRKKAHALMLRLKKKGHKITYDWTQQSQLSPGAANRDATGVTNAEVVVVLWPGRFGTATEMGMAIAQHKTVLVVGKVNRRKSVYFFHPCVKFVADAAELEENLAAREQATS